MASSAQAAAKLLAGAAPEKAKIAPVTGAQALADEISAVGLTPVWSQSDEPVADPKVSTPNSAGSSWRALTRWPMSQCCGARPFGPNHSQGTRHSAGQQHTGRGGSCRDWSRPVLPGKPQAPVFHEAAERARASDRWWWATASTPTFAVLTPRVWRASRCSRVWTPRSPCCARVIGASHVPARQPAGAVRCLPRPGRNPWRWIRKSPPGAVRPLPPLRTAACRFTHRRTAWTVGVQPAPRGGDHPDAESPTGPGYMGGGAMS